MSLGELISLSLFAAILAISFVAAVGLRPTRRHGAGHMPLSELLVLVEKEKAYVEESLVCSRPGTVVRGRGWLPGQRAATDVQSVLVRELT
jgi:hypothetical protein